MTGILWQGHSPWLGHLDGELGAVASSCPSSCTASMQALGLRGQAREQYPNPNLGHNNLLKVFSGVLSLLNSLSCKLQQQGAEPRGKLQHLGHKTQPSSAGTAALFAHTA